jgi:hypothetical protein
MAEQTSGPGVPELPRGASCLECGYLLWGLSSSRCPECGRPFDPSDARSFRVGAKRAFKWWWKQPPLWTSVAACVLVFVWASAASSPVTRVRMGSPGIVSTGLSVLLLDYLFGLLGFLGRGASPGTGDSAGVKHRSGWRWLAIPLCWLLVFLGSTSDLPFRVRVSLSRDALEQAARMAMSGKPPSTPRWIGLYRVERIYKYGTGTVGFRLTGEKAIGFKLRPAPGITSDVPSPHYELEEWEW